MKRRFPLAGTAAVGLCIAAAPLRVSAETWIGTIGDSMCGSTHGMEHGGNEMSDAECVISCVGNGEKSVLVAGGESREIANPDFPGLASAAGTEVRLTGEADGKRIRVATIEPLRKGKEDRHGERGATGSSRP